VQEKRGVLGGRDGRSKRRHRVGGQRADSGGKRVLGHNLYTDEKPKGIFPKRRAGQIGARGRKGETPSPRREKIIQNEEREKMGKRMIYVHKGQSACSGEKKEGRPSQERRLVVMTSSIVKKKKGGKTFTREVEEEGSRMRGGGPPFFLGGRKSKVLLARRVLHEKRERSAGGGKKRRKEPSTLRKKGEVFCPCRGDQWGGKGSGGK